MSDYQVPQFIDIEAKIIGPLTLKQFLYLAMGGVILFFAYFFVKFWLFAMLAIIIGGISLAFAFLKIHGRPFSFFVINFFKFVFRPKIYLWQKEQEKQTANVEPKIPLGKKLSDLSSKLNIFKKKDGQS